MKWQAISASSEKTGTSRAKLAAYIRASSASASAHKLRGDSLPRQMMAVAQKVRVVQRRHQARVGTIIAGKKPFGVENIACIERHNRAAIRVLHINRWHSKLLWSQQESNHFQYSTPRRVMQDKRARNRCLPRLIIFLFTAERKYAIINR